MYANCTTLIGGGALAARSRALLSLMVLRCQRPALTCQSHVVSNVLFLRRKCGWLGLQWPRLLMVAGGTRAPRAGAAPVVTHALVVETSTVGVHDFLTAAREDLGA